MNDARFQTKEALRQKANRSGEDANEKEGEYRNAVDGNSRSRREAKWERTTGALVNRVRRESAKKRRATYERDDEVLSEDETLHFEREERVRQKSRETYYTKKGGMKII